MGVLHSGLTSPPFDTILALLCRLLYRTTVTSTAITASTSIIGTITPAITVGKLDVVANVSLIGDAEDL